MPAAITPTPPKASRDVPAPPAPDRGSLADPLEYLLIAHLRQRDLCGLIDRLAADPVLDRGLAARVVDGIARDLATHALDDEEDLYPLLRRRAKPEDRVEGILGLLAGEHAADGRAARDLLEGLRAAAERGTALDEPFRDGLRRFAERLRRRLAVENALLMPLADARLTPADRVGLARRIAARRGIRLARGGHG